MTIDFSRSELSVIYDAIKYYKSEKLKHDKLIDYECDLILHKLYSKITINNIEPAYRSDI